MGKAGLNLTTGYTDRDESTSLVSIADNIHVLLKILLLAVVVLIMGTDIITCIAMSRTKRTPFPTRLLTCFSLVCDVAFVLAVCLGYVCVTFNQGPVCVAFGTEIGRITIVLSWLSVTLMLVERVICFWYPTMYTRCAQNKQVVKYTASIMTVVVVFKLLTRYVILPIARHETMDMVTQTRDEHIMVTLLGVCLCIGVFCHIIVISIVRKHIRQIHALQQTSVKVLRSYNSTKSIIIIFVAFLCVNVPLFVVLVWKNIVQNTHYLRLASLLAMLTLSIVNPFLYAWRFKECRFIIINTLTKPFNILENRREEMRRQVYDVVTKIPVSDLPNETFNVTELAEVPITVMCK